MACNNHSLQQENDRLKDLIEIYQDYLYFLNEANKAPISMACIHGYRCDEEIIAQGEKYRKDIEEIESEIIWKKKK